ncbi:MAG TPA: hypothetical protein EYP78_03575 [Candidatus Omnitrophica bacterium]|nr:hypothetical protein [Candidatus Omnitrophota bacterium]
MSLPKARTHKDYQEFVRKELTLRRIKIPLKFQDVAIKLYQLDLSPVSHILKDRYSHRGTSGRDPQDMLRSLLAMTELGITSIDDWVDSLRSFPELAIISGFLPEDTPGVGTFYDFFNRLYLMDKEKSCAKGKTKFRRKPKKRKEDHLPEHEHKGIIRRLVERAMRESSKEKNGESSYKPPDYLLQKIFKECFVLPSARLGLIDLNNLSVAGDGSKIKTCASPYGKKICSCEGPCNHPRIFSDRDARWGWDSFHEIWIYGYGIHALVEVKSELPIILPKLSGANTHDGVIGVDLIREAIRWGYRIKHAIFDSAYDNYHFYRFLVDWCHTSPIIMLNKRCEGISYNKDLIFFTPDGVPMCLYGLPLANWGFCWDRGRNKWRCPICSLVQYKDEECPYRGICQRRVSDYGRVFYTYPKENYRYFTPVPRDTELWDELYAKRSGCERSFKREKEDYKLGTTRGEGKRCGLLK